MDFFGQQDRARAATRKLVLLFCCAVVALIAAATLVIYGVLVYAGYAPSTGIDNDLLFSDILLKAALGVIAVVILGSLYRYGQLRAGGRAVAESMNARLINLNTRDPDERKVLNVVEEMAIASGMPVPPVYLIEDPAINAFAAGYRQEDAVIGVTRGCIAHLDRDELQGVIAHEFSHIFHGDMRLNIHLIGVLYGIMVIGLIGYYMLRGGAYRQVGQAGRGNRRGNGLALAGLGLVVVGYAGTFFGNLIKAAVSRQREFLADASAVQYTRNPQGIAGALKKIGGLEEGSRIRSVNVAEYSHMLFEEGANAGFSGLFATHPPLEERIRRLDPQWRAAEDGDGGKPSGPAGMTPATAAGFTGQADASAGSTSPTDSATAAGATAATSAVDAIGNPTAAHLALVREQLSRMPPALLEDAHSTLGACFLVYALLIDRDDAPSAQAQRDGLRAAHTPAQFTQLQAVRERVDVLPRELRLPLLELALPSLKQLSPTQTRDFLTTALRLIMADRRMSLFEWSLFRILRQHLDPDARAPRDNLHFDDLVAEVVTLLAALAAVGHQREEERRVAFDRAAGYLNEEAGILLETRPPPRLEQLDAAADRVRALAPLHKPVLLRAMAKCIDADGRVLAAEAELLRAVSAVLDCPVPPLLGGQSYI